MRHDVKYYEPPIGYINAGGRGTRLNSLFTPHPVTGIAKALLEVGDPGTKLVDHHIARLRQHNIEQIVVAAGDQPDVYEYVNDIYRNDGVTVTQSRVQLGNGGDLAEYVRANDITSALLIQNVDTILDLDLTAFHRHFLTKQSLGAVASIGLTLNKGVPNEGAYSVDATDRVLHSAEFGKPEDEHASSTGNAYNGSSTGAVMIGAAFLKAHRWTPHDGQLSLYRDCLRAAWAEGSLYAYNNKNLFFRDVGTVAMWLNSQNDLVFQSHLNYNQPITT